MAKTLTTSKTGGRRSPMPRSLPFALFASLLLFPPPASSQKISTITITAAPAIPSAVPQFTDGETFTSAILNSTNAYRSAHNASAVVWNGTLASFATDYLASDKVGAACAFAHSGGPYGENLAIGYADATASVEAWGDEGGEYDFGKPGFSEATGHFTQLVWKDTSAVGCGRRLCGERGWYLVCEYWPRGNVVGAFADEVDGPEKSSAPALSSRGGGGWFWRGLVAAGVVALWIVC
ncbi:CAP domain-containing protein [Nemania sp. NC0429]|nr:CAP domain-containing protein [Nemania sp. NC0429]